MNESKGQSRTVYGDLHSAGERNYLLKRSRNSPSQFPLLLWWFWYEVLKPSWMHTNTVRLWLRQRKKPWWVLITLPERLHTGIQLQMTVQLLSALIKCWRCLILFKGISPLEKGSVVIDKLLYSHRFWLCFYTEAVWSFFLTDRSSFSSMFSFDVGRLDWAQNVPRWPLTVVSVA